MEKLHYVIYEWSVPKPLSGARMELLDGLPTVVGGYDNKQQNDILYQVQYILGPKMMRQRGCVSAAVNLRQ